MPKKRHPKKPKQNYFTASLRAEPALNAGTFDSGISIVSFVRGLRPVRAARVLTEKVPKPIRETLSPSARASLTESNTAFTAASASFFESSAFAATAATSSVLLILISSVYCRIIIGF